MDSKTQMLVSCKSHQKQERNSTLSSTPKTILNLNNDCFEEIFSYLNLDNLLEAASVCVRFQERARDTFRRRFGEKVLINKKSLKTSLQILRHFGSVISKLSIDFKPSQHDAISRTKDRLLFRYLTKYCSSVTMLKKLTFVRSVNRIDLSKSFDRVEKLTFFDCDFRINETQLTDYFPNLLTLSLKGGMNYESFMSTYKFLKRTFQSVRNLKLDVSCFNNPYIMNDMLQLNPQIQKLTLLTTDVGSRFPSQGIWVTSSLLEMIDKILPQLECFACYCSCIGFSTNKSSCFKNLTHLHLSSDNCEPKLSQFIILIDKYPKVTHIELRLWTNFVLWTSDEVAEFLANSKQLEKIVFIHIWCLDNTFVDTIYVQFENSGWNVINEPNCIEIVKSSI